jgi:uncharacterized protein with HEPN domain
MNRLRRHDPTVAARITAYEEIVGMRNVLVHGYDIVRPSTIWEAITVSLPVLRAEVESLLREHAEGGA